MTDCVEEAFRRLEASTDRLVGSLRDMGFAVCPACEAVVPERELAEHARSYRDERHAVVEVMAT